MKFAEKCPFCCCKLNKEERLFAKAKSILEEEIDIVLLLKKIRKFELFMNLSLLNSEVVSNLQLEKAEMKSISENIDNIILPTYKTGSKIAPFNEEMTHGRSGTMLGMLNIRDD